MKKKNQRGVFFFWTAFSIAWKKIERWWCSEKKTWEKKKKKNM